MNRFDYRDSRARRRSARVAMLAAGGLIGAVALTGCSAGQVAQTAMQQSAVDGNQAVINNVALRNVRIQALQTGDFLRPGATVDLVLVAVNQSPDITDKLVGITTDIGKVTVTGDPTLHASGVLFVGSQNGQSKKSDRAVENGISCMSCHARGMILKDDQVRPHVLGNPAAFSKEDRDTILALYPPREKFAELIQKDSQRFKDAVARTGAQLSASEPVGTALTTSLASWTLSV